MKLKEFFNIEKLLLENPELNLDVNDYNINVTANYGEKIHADEVLQRYKSFDGAGKPTHLYFHVPICLYVCHFCNYVKKKANGKEEELDLWVKLLIKESDFYLKQVSWIKSADIQSVYFGGGTATALGLRRLNLILDHIKENYQINENCEYTLEGNPDNFLHTEVEQAIAAGFNRFSLGVQSLQNEVNKFTGRGHDAEMSLAAIKNLKASGKPFNVDMMFGLPYQTAAHVRKDIETLTGLGVSTITIYRLRNVDREKMGIGNLAAWNVPKIREKMVAQHLFPSLHETYLMRDAAVEALLDHDYNPSPCGWWNAPNAYPNGNIPQVSKNKWEQFNSMIAFGPGAYGWLSGDSADILQTHNEQDINAYITQMEHTGDRSPMAFGRFLQDTQAVATALGFAVKANQRISLKRFKRIYGVNLLIDTPYKEVLEELLEKKFLAYDPEGYLKTTLAGEALHEEVISIYIHKKIGEFSLQTCTKF